MSELTGYIRFIAGRALLLYAVSVTVGCAPSQTMTPPLHEPNTLGEPVVFHTPSTVSVKLLDSSWRETSNTRVDDATAVRADHGDALIVFGDDAIRVWLKQGSELVISSQSNAIALTLTRGHIRAADRDANSTFWLATDDESRARISLAGRDVLVTATSAGPRVVDTLSALEAADWTLQAGERDVEPSFGELAGSDGEPVQLTTVSMRAAHRDDMVALEVEHVFRNDSDLAIEGTFRFPLPQAAILTGLAMTIDGKLMEGEIVEREKARAIYERIVDEMRDPALLEWEQGRQLKLRVFPIEANADKHVVVRYLMPVRQTPEGPMVSLDLMAPALQTSALAVDVRFDGQTVLTESAFVAGRRLDIPVPKAALDFASILRQQVGEAAYTRIRVTPKLDGLRARPAQRRLLVVVDTSRSSLESRSIAGETLEAALSKLRPRDRFMVLGSDVSVSELTSGFVSATRANREAAVSAFEGIEPDGASDLGAALTAISRVVDRGTDDLQVLYIGDGTATWGQTDPAALLAVARAGFGGVALHAAVVGKAADAGLLTDIAGATGGKVVTPTSRRDAERFGLFLSRALGSPRLINAQVTLNDGDVYPKQPTTLFAGDSLEVLARQSVSGPLDGTLTGIIDGRDVAWPVGTGMPIRSSTTVARRFAALEIATLTRQDASANKDNIIKLSKDFGVMSRFTALLVLENEDAYKRHKIERRRGPQTDPTVTGGDLESLSADEARLSPDHIQPGDPEIRVPAPEDARSVVMVFPFGETKVARFEPELKAWTVRFLIPKSTPDGLYTVVVRITHADGAVETLELDYVVDTQAPQLAIAMRKADQRWHLEARSIERPMPTRRRADLIVAGGDPLPAARIVGDTIRVEARLPNGRIVRLKVEDDGVFRASWRPKKALPEAPSVRFVAIDRARNRSVQTVPLSERSFDDPANDDADNAVQEVN